jgi:hypothetical protein
VPYGCSTYTGKHALAWLATANLGSQRHGVGQDRAGLARDSGVQLRHGGWRADAKYRCGSGGTPRGYQVGAVAWAAKLCPPETEQTLLWVVKPFHGELAPPKASIALTLGRVSTGSGQPQ